MATSNPLRKKPYKSYMTPTEAAAALMVSPVTIRQWAQKGVLKACTTAGGHRRFPVSEIASFALNQGIDIYQNNDPVQRLLIVDDDVHLADYLRDVISSACPNRMQIEVAYNGFSAGDKLHVFEPHLLLLDLIMPGMDGFGVCELIKSRPETFAIEIIAMTGDPAPENISRIMNLGARACLEKPIDTASLISHLGISSAQLAQYP